MAREEPGRSVNEMPVARVGPADRQVARLDDGLSVGDCVRSLGGFLADERADTRRRLCAAHQLGGGRSELGGPLEGGQGDQNDDGQEHLRQGPGSSLWDADEERADDGCAHGDHVESAREGRQLRGAPDRAGKLLFGALEGSARLRERSRQRELGGALQNREARGGDVGACGRPLGFGQAYRAGDERGSEDSRDDEGHGEDQAGRGGNERDGPDRAHADDEGYEGGQERLDDDVADLVHVRPGARHEVAASQTRQGGGGLEAQAVVEVAAQRVHPFEGDPVGGQARQVARECARDAEEPDGGGRDGQVEDRRLLGGTGDEPRRGAS